MCARIWICGSVHLIVPAQESDLCVPQIPNSGQLCHTFHWSANFERSNIRLKMRKNCDRHKSRVKAVHCQRIYTYSQDNQNMHRHGTYEQYSQKYFLGIYVASSVKWVIHEGTYRAAPLICFYECFFDKIFSIEIAGLKTLKLVRRITAATFSSIFGTDTSNTETTHWWYLDNFVTAKSLIVHIFVKKEYFDGTSSRFACTFQKSWKNWRQFW